MPGSSTQALVAQQAASASVQRGAIGAVAVRRPRRAAGALIAATTLVAAATGAQSEDRDPTLFYQQDGLTIRGHVQAGLNLVVEENLFWNLSEPIFPK